MTYHGKIKNGVVVLEAGADLPEGTPVRVEALEQRPLMDLVQSTEQHKTDPNWPHDGAAEHDHYLYGIPKRSQ
jgi:hypothetical protein